MFDATDGKKAGILAEVESITSDSTYKYGQKDTDPLKEDSTTPFRIDEERYGKWLENMVILLSKCYQETYDMLLEKLKNKETNAYLSMPTVQGTSMIIAVETISKEAKNNGKYTATELDAFVKRLISSMPK